MYKLPLKLCWHLLANDISSLISYLIHSTPDSIPQKDHEQEDHEQEDHEQEEHVQEDLEQENHEQEDHEQENHEQEDRVGGSP